MKDSGILIQSFSLLQLLATKNTSLKKHNKIKLCLILGNSFCLKLNKENDTNVYTGSVKVANTVYKINKPRKSPHFSSCFTVLSHNAEKDSKKTYQQVTARQKCVILSI